MNNDTIIIIGAGLSGLSAACLLARRGFRVTVLEKEDIPGGVARNFSEKGFTFDRGPSWYLMPEVFDRFFSIFGKSTSDYLELVDLDPSYRIYFHDRDSAVITRDLERNCALFESIEPGSGQMLRRYLEEARYKYDTAMEEFLYREYSSIFDFFNKKMLIEGTRLHIFNKLDRYARRFFANDRLRKILEYNIVFLGCTPFKSPALYSLMSHVDITQGVRYPMGGIYSLVDALYRLALEQGVQFMFNSTVTGINVKNGCAESVTADGERIPAHRVLCTTDYHHGDTELLEARYRGYSDRYWNSRTLAPSALLMHLGLDRKVPGLEHHTLYLSESWDEHFASIFDRPGWPSDPSYYIGCPSKTDPGVAPDGCENVFVLVPVAPGLDDSDEKRGALADSILDHMGGLLGTDIKGSVMFRRIVSHRQFAAGNLFRGTALGLAHTLFQTARFRPSHRSRKVRNLYYSGHYTHPGIGMPMVMISSQVVSEIICREYDKK